MALHEYFGKCGSIYFVIEMESPGGEVKKIDGTSSAVDEQLLKDGRKTL